MQVVKAFFGFGFCHHIFRGSIRGRTHRIACNPVIKQEKMHNELSEQKPEINDLEKCNARDQSLIKLNFYERQAWFVFDFDPTQPFEGP